MKMHYSQIETEHNLPIPQIIDIVIVYILLVWALPAEVAVAEVVSLQRGRIRVVKGFDEVDTGVAADPEGDV